MPVVYAGHKFDSLGEARFAVALTNAEISWVYEPLRIELGEAHGPSDKPYTTPDFWLPDVGCLIDFTDERLARAEAAGSARMQEKQATSYRLAKATQRPVLSLRTYPFPHRGNWTMPERSTVFWPDGSCTPGDEVDLAKARHYGAEPLFHFLTDSSHQRKEAFLQGYMVRFGQLDRSTGQPSADLLGRCLELERSEVKAFNGLSTLAKSIALFRTRPAFICHRFSAEWAESFGVTADQVAAAFKELVTIGWIAKAEEPR